MPIDPNNFDSDVAIGILEGSSFGIALFDLTTMQMIWHNPCFKKLTWFGTAEGGRKATQVVLSDLFLEDDLEVMDKLVAIASQTGFSYDSERPMRRGTRRSFMSKISFRTFKGEDGETKQLCLEVVDLSLEKLYEELKTREEQLRKTQAELVQKSKMASIGEMAGGIAHEINNPLAIIDGRAHYLKLMIEEGNIEQKKALTHIKSICDTVRRAANVVKSIRAISEENSSNDFQVIDLVQIISTSAAIYREKLKSEGVAFTVDLPEDGTKVLCNPAQISQLVLNMLKNSLEATLRAEARPAWIRINSEKKDDVIYIRIEDSGEGVPKSIQHRIMDPFFSTKDVGDGTGLGLSISQRIAESHGGQMYLDSEQEYTCFVIEIPLKPGASKEKSA